MRLPLQLSFRDIAPTEPIKNYVEKRAAKLDTFDPNIMRCRVVISAPHRHRQHGRHYRVHIAVTVPTGELVVDRDPARHKGFEDLYAAVDEAFDQMKRAIEDAVQLRRHRVKRHESPYQRGTVTKLFHRSGFGFLETPQGEEIYFHRNAVLRDSFAKLKLGEVVRFVAEPGEQGPQASSVIAHPTPRAAAAGSSAD